MVILSGGRKLDIGFTLRSEKIPLYCH